MAANTTDEMKKLECPINWDLEEMNIGGAAKKLLLRSESRSDEAGDASSTWQEVALFLCLAYLEYHSSDEDNKMNEHLKHVKELCEQRKQSYPFIRAYYKSINYVVKAMWVHYYHKKGLTEDAQLNLKLISPFEKLSPKEKAGVWAIKSCCFMAFGPYDNSKALTSIEKALELDTEEAEWSFLKGKCLARTRRCLNYRSSPSDLELDCLQKVVEKNTKSASHYVFCALSFQERGLSATSHLDKKKFLDESYKLFKQGAAYSFDAPTSLARIARGLMRMPYIGGPNLWLLVDTSVRRAYQLCPDSGLVNHVAANFYSKTGQGNKDKIQKCVFHLKRAAFHSGVFGAYINLFDMYTANTAPALIDIDEVVTNFWEEFKDVPVDRFKALKPMAAYYLHVKNDALKAAEMWKEWMQSPKNTDKDESNKIIVKYDNMTKAITDKVRKVLEESTSVTSEEKLELQVFLDAAAAFSQAR